MSRIALIWMALMLPHTLVAMCGAPPGLSAGWYEVSAPYSHEHYIRQPCWENSLEIVVRDRLGRTIADAHVVVITSDDSGRITAEFDEPRGLYSADVSFSRPVTVEVMHPGFNPVKRFIEQIPAHGRVLITLFQPGDSVAYVGGWEFWYLPKTDTIGFMANLSGRDKVRTKRKKTVKGPRSPRPVQDDEHREYIASAIGMRPEQLGFIMEDRTRTGQYWCTLILTAEQARERRKIIAALRQNPIVGAAGPICYLVSGPSGDVRRASSQSSDRWMSIFTNHIALIFSRSRSADDVRKFLEERGLKLVWSESPWGLHMVSAAPETAEDINAIVRELQESGLVKYVSVELAGPTDIPSENY